ncbi:hypothetical protein RHSIM_Rhsim11G0093400 [Rhododendron simsii]|uniref:Integrase catalytic domain-containing protein n=1 Tax=Rhododendron simsii TaxID=118357 RepID=A0A834G8E7_RHOSS|nr:hypothetical protein RHSIM_Rhsim11G0093400 [Rhododendron simsii]
MTQRDFDDKRAKGLCFGCDEKYFRGHVCKKKQIFMLEADEEDEIFEDTQQELLQGDNQEEFQISLHALSGIQSYRTMRIIGQLKKKMLHILIDSGSTHNFLDPKIAKTTGVESQPTNPLTVVVADGTKIFSKAMVKDFNWTMQGAEFTADMRLLPLGGCDIILGVQWLSTLGPVLWDFKNLKMEFTVLGAKHTLKGGEVPAVQLVDVKTMEQLLRRHPLGVMAQMCSIQAATSEQVQVNPEISMLLQNYEDVFSEPQGLPPVRAHDHQIPLFPGTQPPSIRPYRYPYIQKNEIEKIVREMMEAGVIRHNQRITTPMQQKWLPKMMGFDYEIVYRSGKSNVAADALSRMVENTDPISENQGSLTALTVVLCNWVKELQLSWENDPALQTIITDLQQDPTSHPLFVWQHQMLYYKSRLVVGKDDQFRLKLIQEHHASPTGGHSGGERSYYRLKQAFYWKGMKRAVLKVVAEFAQAFLDNVFKLHGMPRSIVSDRDTIFTSSFWQELFRLQGTSLNLSTSYHPQSDGQTEVVNRCLENYLRCLTGDRPKVWVHWLPLAEWWYNTTFHISTGITPYEALYGQSPPDYRHYTPGGTTIAAADGLLKDRETVLKLLKEHLISSQHRMKQIADSHRTEREFEVGDWVYLRLQPFRQVSVAFRRNAKLAPKYFGPYQVMQRVGAVAYKLDLPPSSRIHPVFHVSLLKKKLGFGAVVQSVLPLTDDDGRLQIEPLAILERKLVKRNNRPYTMVLVQWTNSIPEDATWESWYELHQRFPNFQP